MGLKMQNQMHLFQLSTYIHWFSNIYLVNGQLFCSCFSSNHFTTGNYYECLSNRIKIIVII